MGTVFRAGVCADLLQQIPSKAVRKMLDPLLKRGGPSVKQRNPGAGSGLDADCSLVFTPTPSSHGDSQPSSAGSFGTADDSLTDDGESDDRFSNSSGLSPGSRSVSTSPVPAVDASGHAIEPVKTQMSSIKRWPHFGIDLGTDTSRSCKFLHVLGGKSCCVPCSLMLLERTKR